MNRGPVSVLCACIIHPHECIWIWRRKYLAVFHDNFLWYDIKKAAAFCITVMSRGHLDVWIITSLRMWGFVLHVEHMSCFITNCGQHQRLIRSRSSMILYALPGKTLPDNMLSLSLELFPKVCSSRLLFPVILCYSYHLPIPSSGWVVIAACGSISVWG